MFRVGQKVVCVDASTPAAWAGSGEIFEGRIYTIRRVGLTVTNEPGVKLYETELTSPPGRVGIHTGKPFRDLFYLASRFRPIVEKKTDIAIFHEILNKVTRKHKERV